MSNNHAQEVADPFPLGTSGSASLGNPRPYRFGGFTYYYSRPNMTTKGTLKIGETTYQIEGTTWFDRQYGKLFQAIIQGWQWFAIQLESGEHIMLFDFLGSENRVERFGSVLDADGESRHLGPEDYAVETLGSWPRSPSTAARASNSQVKPLAVATATKAVSGKPSRV